VEAHDPVDLVVFFNAEPDLVADWAESADLPSDVRVVADPDATLYEELGTTRQDPVRLMLKAVRGAIRSAREGIFARPTRADMLRLGADVAVDADGNIVLLHVASGPDDRVPMDRLVASLSA
jgi:hypothetical protein